MSEVDVSIEWPQMVVSIGIMELTYDLDDVLNIESDPECEILEITDHGMVVEYGERKTEFIDMRPVMEMAED